MKVSSIALVLVLLGLSWVQMTAPVFASTGAQQPTRHAALKTSGVTRAHSGKFNFAGVPLTFENYESCLVEMQFVAANANSRVIPGQ
jgi:hypothetical protein